MRLALHDVKKTVRRRDGVAYVMPYLLRPRERLHELEALVALFEAWIGRERAAFPADRPAELVGDYRLARCLATCLGEWYTWQAPEWPGAASAAEAAALAAHELTSPGRLRLALYDYVHAVAGGFLPTNARESALEAFSAEVGIARGTLDDLLSLDGEERAVLARVAAQSPTARELAARYNARAFEALMASAAEVEWRVPPPVGSLARAESLGSVVKRICFLARQMGVHYDVAFERVSAVPENSPAVAASLPLVAEARAPYTVPSAGAEEGVDSLDRAGQTVVITLYGPQGLTGSPIQYGDRLARLCRALLGYRRDRAAPGQAALAADGLEGQARVLLNGRPLLFPLDERLLKLLRSEALADDTDDTDAREVAAAEHFDSALERRLHEDFAALERAGAAHGWHLEREPEPVLAADTIMVPDFALTRGRRRVYLEIAGYWRPDYRERKVRKLAVLRGAVALVLAVPRATHGEFAALEASYPLLWFDTRVSAEALLALLDRHYDDLAERLAGLDAEQINREVALRGRIPPAESMALLHCYTRNELARALDHVRALRAATAPPHRRGVEWLDGIGLVSAEWSERLHRDMRTIVASAPGERITLGALGEALARHLPDLKGIAEEAVEQAARHAGLFISRASIFQAEVALAPGAETASPAADSPHSRPRPQPRGAARRKSARAKPTATTLPIFPSADDPGADGA